MTLSAFKALNLYNRIDRLFHQGIQLTTRRERNYMVGLYQLGRFYVEVYYDRKEKDITEVRAFENMATLEPYLEAINIEPLLQRL